MQEIFYEETINDHNSEKSRRKYLTFKIIGIIFYVFAGLLIAFGMFSCTFTPVDKDASLKNSILGLVLFFLVPAILFFIGGFYCQRIKYRFMLSYDYTFVTGSVRIAKVLNGVKRKPLIKFDYTNIVQIGRVGSETYEKYAGQKEYKKIFATPNNETNEEERKDFYYMAVSVDGEKKLVIIECTELFLVNILKFANKSVLEKDFVTAKKKKEQL